MKTFLVGCALQVISSGFAIAEDARFPASVMKVVVMPIRIRVVELNKDKLVLSGLKGGYAIRAGETTDDGRYAVVAWEERSCTSPLGTRRDCSRLWLRDVKTQRGFMLEVGRLAKNPEIFAKLQIVGSKEEITVKDGEIKCLTLPTGEACFLIKITPSKEIAFTDQKTKRVWHLTLAE